MKKKVTMKGILLIIILSVLALGSAGCGSVIITPTTTGTVYITVDSWDDYYIAVDGSGLGYTDWTGYFTIYNVPVGYHTFEAIGYYYGYYGIVTNRYIKSGNNYVTIYTY